MIALPLDDAGPVSEERGTEQRAERELAFPRWDGELEDNPAIR
jgi:hypothetical protein